MPRFLVNLGSHVTVDAANAGEAIEKAKSAEDRTYFHTQVQEILVPEVVDAARVEEARLLDAAHEH